MPTTGSARNLRAIIRALSPAVPAQGTAGSATREETALCEWGPEDWSRVLFALPFEAHSFSGEFEQSWETVIEQLTRWRTEFAARPEPFRSEFRAVGGYLGLLLLTLVSLAHSYQRRYDQGERMPHDCAALCVPAVEDPAVREAIRTLYAPDAPIPDVEGSADGDAATLDAWRDVDAGTLRFHRHGTTSFILTGLPLRQAHGRRIPFALKCIVYPYLRVPTIVRATRDYRSSYGDVRAGEDAVTEALPLARAWASSGRWILMDFVPGETLAEYLSRQQARPRIRLDLLRDLGPRLLGVLDELDRCGLRHGDLSPSNIILSGPGSGPGGATGAGGRRFVLIDLGVNYLYSHTVPGSGGPDAAFVAPEVRSETMVVDPRQADLYAVGQLLVAIGGGHRETAAAGASAVTVPDPFYAETPLLARFVEDLTDRVPENRLLLFRPTPGERLYPQLLHFYEEELAAVEATRAQSAGTRFVRLYTPLAGAPRQQLQMWRIRRTQSLYHDPHRGMHVRWLLFFSWLSAAAWYVAAWVVITYWLRDLDWDWGNNYVTLLQRTNSAGEQELPLLDGLRLDGYTIPDNSANAPVRLVGMSFLLAGARYYQNLFAGLTPLVAGRGQGRLSRRALLAEVSMRLFTLIPAVLVLSTTLFHRDWWPICTAIGILSTALCNAACLVFARAAIAEARARQLGTVPQGRIAGLDALYSWTLTAGFYSVACWGIGLSIYAGTAKDVYIYAGSVAAINVVIFYIARCSGSAADEVRTILTRACLASERLRHLPVPAATAAPARTSAPAAAPATP